jgi:hypothetical protein
MVTVAALYTIATPMPFMQGASIGVVADDSSADYVFADGVNPLGLSSGRAQRIAKLVGVQPKTASEWLKVACYNLGYYEFSPATSAPNLRAASQAVKELVHQRNAANQPNS